ncbi:MAG: flagellar hook-basal body complex protein [Roseburia sp.]|nr:flagellar hook-basal body complex protein [Roseburia sp.]
MMRSLFSGVSGLKTHQTRMDVIGNNIANVNTTGYKSKSINFSDMLYQTTQAATGPNVESAIGGTNPRQIGLGVKTGAINTSITTQGATQSTGNPFDVKLNGEAFFIVSDGTSNYFTRDGSFGVDAAGYLTMANTGYTVMGWTQKQATDDGGEAIIASTVRPINVMNEQTYPAAYTTMANITGIIDKYDDNLGTTSGRQINIQTYDDRGYEYNLKFGIKPVTNSQTSTKNVTNTEKLYQLPGCIVNEDISTLKFYKTVAGAAGGTNALGEQLSATGLPSALLEAIENEARTGAANARDKAHTDGTKDDPVVVTINDAFLTHYKITDLGDASTLKGSSVTVVFSGETGFVGYKNAGGNVNGNTRLGVLDIDEAAITALYGAVPALGTAAGQPLAAAFAGGLLVTEKVYTDGTPTQYAFNQVAAGPVAANGSLAGAAVNLNYADVAALLATDGTPKTQAQYTSVEDTTLDTRIEGNYTITLLGMTDSNGADVDPTNTIVGTAFNVVYNTGNGDFEYVGSEGNTSFTLNLSTLGPNFSNVSFDMSKTTNVDNGNKSTVAGKKVDGRKVGVMTGASIGTDGTVTINYSNGMSRAIAKIAVATFANAMGLQNEGNNLYTATANSGEFDGIGVDIKASGTGDMTTGVLEMSNVDLSQEFTDMITTQRGFQANSRIITVSDTLLEELVNLKR